MRNLSKVATLALAIISLPAEASVTGNGTISQIIPLAGGQVLFDLSGYRGPTPACHASGTRWAFDGTTIQGQQKLAVLLTAFASGKQIQVTGKGVCDVWGDTESVDYIVTAV